MIRPLTNRPVSISMDAVSRYQSHWRDSPRKVGIPTLQHASSPHRGSARGVPGNMTPRRREAMAAKADLDASITCKRDPFGTGLYYSYKGRSTGSKDEAEAWLAEDRARAISGTRQRRNRRGKYIVGPSKSVGRRGSGGSLEQSSNGGSMYSDGTSQILPGRMMQHTTTGYSPARKKNRAPGGAGSRSRDAHHAGGVDSSLLLGGPQYGGGAASPKPFFSPAYQRRRPRASPGQTTPGRMGGGILGAASASRSMGGPSTPQRGGGTPSRSMRAGDLGRSASRGNSRQGAGGDAGTPLRTFLWGGVNWGSMRVESGGAWAGRPRRERVEGDGWMDGWMVVVVVVYEVGKSELREGTR